MGNQAVAQLTAKSNEIKAVKSRMKDLGLSSVAIERETSFALQTINKSRDLMECTKESILVSIINAAQIGLTLNPAAKQACLVSRWNGKLRQKECLFEPMYGGLIYLACEEGVVKNINPQIVYKGDHFEARPYDTENPIIHSFNTWDTDRTKEENILGFYCIATLPDGIKQAEIMSKPEVDVIRDNADAYIAYKAGKIKSTPWATSYGEMGRKTVIKRQYKYLNKKGGQNYSSKLDEAIEIDNQGYGAAHWQLSKIEELLRIANISAEQNNAIYREFESYTYQQAKDCIAYLEENKLDEGPRFDGRMNQTAARKAVAEAVENERN